MFLHESRIRSVSSLITKQLRSGMRLCSVYLATHHQKLCVHCVLCTVKATSEQNPRVNSRRRRSDMLACMTPTRRRGIFDNARNPQCYAISSSFKPRLHCSPVTINIRLQITKSTSLARFQSRGTWKRRKGISPDSIVPAHTTFN